jgi:hypothetical protein
VLAQQVRIQQSPDHKGQSETPSQEPKGLVAKRAAKGSKARKVLLAKPLPVCKAHKGLSGQLVLIRRLLGHKALPDQLVCKANVASKALPEQQGQSVTVGRKAGKVLRERLGHKAISAKLGLLDPKDRDLLDPKAHKAWLAQRVNAVSKAGKVTLAQLVPTVRSPGQLVRRAMWVQLGLTALSLVPQEHRAV